jgi:hypothetical protein
MTVNEADLVREACLAEQGCEEINIAQATEFTNKLLTILATSYAASEWCELIERHKE